MDEAIAAAAFLLDNGNRTGLIIDFDGVSSDVIDLVDDEAVSLSGAGMTYPKTAFQACTHTSAGRLGPIG
jgi:hypothetical protein